MSIIIIIIIDVWSKTTSLRVHTFNSILNTSLPAYTQLQFLHFYSHKSVAEKMKGTKVQTLGARAVAARMVHGWLLGP